MVTTLIYDLQRRGGGIGVASMCAGGGMGGALVIEVPAWLQPSPVAGCRSVGVSVPGIARHPPGREAERGAERVVGVGQDRAVVAVQNADPGAAEVRRQPGPGRPPPKATAWHAPPCAASSLPGSPSARVGTPARARSRGRRPRRRNASRSAPTVLAEVCGTYALAIDVLGVLEIGHHDAHIGQSIDTQGIRARLPPADHPCTKRGSLKGPGPYGPPYTA